jgi:hypothetical protein
MGVKALLARLKPGQTGPLQEPQGTTTVQPLGGGGIGVSRLLGFLGLQRLQKHRKPQNFQGQLTLAMIRKLFHVNEIRQNYITQ